MNTYEFRPTEVKAVQADLEVLVYVHHEDKITILKAEPGDWIVSDLSGTTVVNNKLFQETFVPGQPSALAHKITGTLASIYNKLPDSQTKQDLAVYIALTQDNGVTCDRS